MKSFLRAFSEFSYAGGGYGGEARESFTESFAYDRFQWPEFEIYGAARPSIVEFRTPAERAAEARGLEGQADPDGDATRLYTTTNSDIRVYTTGEVVELAEGFTPQTAQSGPVIGTDDFRADARFAGIDGSGYAVVIIDGGIDLDDPFFGADANNDGIADRIVYQYDFADNDADASDIDGHGSNVASIAASSDSLHTGMAPGADIIALKVFSDYSDYGSFGDVEASLQWVIDNAEAYNIVSVNMSLGDTSNRSAAISLYGIGDELAVLASMNVVVVSASGNDFYSFNSVQGVSYPSADPNSLSIGAVYDGNVGYASYQSGAIAYATGADRITPFSQRDDELTTVFAPGAEIVGAGAGSALTIMHGTSQAAPHITGIIALAQQLAVENLGRKLSYDEIETLLVSTADTIIDGDNENDNVNNTGLAFPRVNLVKLGEAILDMAEPGSFSIAALSASRAEGNSGSTAFTFTVTRSGYSGDSASVGYSVSGGSANAADFAGGTLPAGTVFFAAGETAKTLTILVKGDTLFETNESFVVSLSAPSGGGSIGTGSANGLIINDDAAPPSSFFAIAASDAVKLEGDSGTTAFTFTVTRSGDTAGSGSVAYSLSGAANAADFAGGVLPAGTVSFAAGEVSKTIVIQVAGDSDFEGDEGFTVTLSNPSAGASISTAAAGGTIVNDDAAAPAPTVVLAADFDGPGDTEGFVYSDGLFGGLTSQRYASGGWDDGALSVNLGGVNNNFARDISGGWETSFGLDEAAEITLSFLYELNTGNDYESNEFTQVLVSIDGGAPILVDQLTGDGNGGPDLTAGPQTFTALIGTLAAGSHTLAIGGYNNQKTWNLEESHLVIDDVRLTIAPDDAPPPPNPPVFSIAALDAAKAEGDAGATAFTFTVTRGGDASAAVSVDYAVSGAVDAADFAGGLPAGTLAFAAGETSKTLTLQVAGDTAAEDDEGFTVALSNPSPGSAIDAASAAGTILNDDAAAATTMVTITALDSINAEGNGVDTEAKFSIYRTGDLSQAGWVDYVVSGFGGDAASADDFVGGAFPSGRIAFAANQDLAHLSIPIVGDFDIETDEDFLVTLTAASPGTAISKATAEGTINNDDVTREPTYFSISAANAERAEGDAGTTAFTFEVARSGDLTVPDIVHFSVTGSGVNPATQNDFYSGYGGDYPSGIVYFDTGVTSRTVTVLVAGDGAVEEDETFILTLSDAPPNAEILNASAQGTILNDDTAGRGTTYFFASAYDADKPEGTGGTTAFTFLVTRSGDTTAADTIDYAVAGSGVNPATAADFAGGVLPSGSIAFAAGETSKFLTIQVAADAEVEPEETFTLTISNPPPNGQIQKPTDDATIENDDFPAGGPFVLIDADFNGTSAGTESFTYQRGVFGGTTEPTLTRGNWTSTDITVVLGGGGSTQGTMTGGWERSFTLDQEMELSLSFLYDIFHSRQFEADEYTQVLVSIDGGAPILIDQIAGSAGNTADYIVAPTTAQLDLGTFGPGSHSIVIGGLLNKMDGPDEYNTIGIDDVLLIGSLPPPPPPTSFAIAALDAAKAEGDSGTTAFTFTVTRSGDTGAANSVDYAVSGAADGADFGGSLPAGTVSFAAGETSKTITVQVSGDTDFEADEAFTVTLGNPTGGATITTGSAQGTILNDDTLDLGSFAIAARDTSRAEGNDGESTPFAFEITRTSATAEAGSVYFEVTSSQADGADFSNGVLHSGWINFPAGENFNVVTLGIWVAGDNVVEADETFTVTLSNPSAGFEITTASASATILNDDAAPPATFFAIAADDAVGAEGDAGSTAFTFTVTRSGDTSAAGSVDYAVSGAADAADFMGGLPAGTVSFAAGETGKTITVEVAGDTDFEADEAFTVTLSNASAGSEIVTASAQGTILNDDAAPPATFFAIAAEDAVKAEGDINETFLTFTVTRSGDTSGAGSVDYAVTGAVDGDDFVGGLLPAGSLAFAAGEVSKTLSFNVAGDGLEEPDEAFTVTLSNASAGAAIVTATAEGTILNDDGPPPPPVDTTLTLAAADAVKSEGDGGSTIFSFLVSRSGTPIDDTSVDYSVVGSGDNPADAADFIGGVLPAGTVTIQGEGASSAWIRIEVAGDGGVEPDEGFTVVLSNPSAGAEIASGSASGTILNDDAAAPPPGDAVVLLQADFDAAGDTGGFTYVDRPFGGSFLQRYADGEWSDGALTVTLGGQNNRIATDINGGWEADFTLDEAMDVTLSFDYLLTISAGYEPDEFSQLLVSIDGGAPILIEELVGGGPLTGLFDGVTMDLGTLSAGSHSLVIGGFNNKKSWSDEFTEITIDDVLVTGTAATGSAGGSALPPGGAPLDLANAGLSETELLSTAGF
ncbi:MAG: hypothetical protein Kow00114_15320 [Kiloniellaceae bacterium]